MHAPSRALGTALDLLLLLDMAALGVSGIRMSGFVFAFLPISGGMIVARQMHLFASYWGLILMSAHLGMHMEQFFGMGRKLFHLPEKSAARARMLRALVAAVSVYGIYAFFAQHMADYLFLHTHFVLFDETKAAAVYFAETVAIIGLFAWAAYTINKLLRSIKVSGRGWKVLSFIIPALVCIFVVLGLKLPSQNEPWRSADETQHTVTVSDFYISPYEVKQSDYASSTIKTSRQGRKSQTMWRILSSTTRSFWVIPTGGLPFPCPLPLSWKNTILRAKPLFRSVPTAAGASGKA